MTDHHAYLLALEKITTAPLTLTERDFDTLEAFNPRDAVRGRDAQRTAQLAIVTTAAPPLETKATLVSRLTKAIDREQPDLDQPAGQPPRPARAPVPDWLAPTIVDVVAKPLYARLRTLEKAAEADRTRLAVLEELAKQLSSENKALGNLVSRDLVPARRAPSLDDLSSRSPKH